MEKLPSLQTSHEAESAEQDYVKEKFNPRSIESRERNRDGEEVILTYNKYTIGSREVVFRGSGEFPQVEGEVNWLQPHNTDPIYLQPGHMKETITHSESEDATLIVPTSAEGIIAAAQEINHGTNDMMRQLLDKDGALEMNEATKIFLDAMTAADLYDEAGKPKLPKYELIDGVVRPEHQHNGDGFALMTALLLGDEGARMVVNKKLEQYYHDRQEARVALTNKNKEYEGGMDVEPLSPSEVMLVHSTSYPVEYDENGNALLYAASAKRPDRFPRATIHFTPNGEVRSHMGGEWTNANRLIVASFADMIQENGVPDGMASVDTYFATDPTEPVVLPDARIIEPNGTKDGSLWSREGNVFHYQNSEHYTDTQKQEIEQLAKQYNIDMQDGDYAAALRSAMLRSAGSELGVQQFVDIQAHYTADDMFNRRYSALAAKLDVPYTGLHIYSSDAEIEKNIGRGQYGADIATYASIQANRTAMWSGAIPVATSRKKVGGFSLPGEGEF